MRIFQLRHSRTLTPPTPEPSKRDPRKRLRNLERKRLSVIEQLANPNLGGPERPGVERRLASITNEITELREVVV